MKVYITKTEVISADGKQRIENGKLVMADKEKITTLNGKTEIMIPAGNLKNYIKPCKLTLKDNEVFIMEFITGGWHDFHAVGRNPYEMWKKCIKLFNYEEGTNYNTHTIKNYRFFCDFCVFLSKISIDECYASEGRTDDKYHNKETVSIGDWIEIYY